MLLFSDKVALHVTRPVRWDSDHVVTFNDDVREICKEIVSCGALNRTLIGLDYFDASINRIAAWVIGARAVQKALLFALLTPHKTLKKMRTNADFTHMLALDRKNQRSAVRNGVGTISRLHRYADRMAKVR